MRAHFSVRSNLHQGDTFQNHPAISKDMWGHKKYEDMMASGRERARAHVRIRSRGNEKKKRKTKKRKKETERAAIRDAPCQKMARI